MASVVLNFGSYRSIRLPWLGIVVEGIEAVEIGLAEEADVYDRYFSDNGRVGHSRLERDPPQDGDNEPVRTRVPRP